jgi:hypothetical protein
VNGIAFFCCFDEASEGFYSVKFFIHRLFPLRRL